MKIEDVKTVEDLYKYCKEIKEKNGGFYTLEGCDLNKFKNKGGIEIYFDDKDIIDEKIIGEKFPRIVHIGESDNFARRFNFHFKKHGASIFRDHIRKAIINFFDEFPYWYGAGKDFNDDEIEEKISQYICKLPFLIIDKGKKEDLIKIAVQSVKDGKIKISENWLGKFSGNQKIKKSGLWNIDGV